MASRSSFPRIFWISNSLEILERFAYYGIFFSFGIYLEHLGFSRGDLGIIQSIFLSLSYLTPLFSGTLADKIGFKKVFLISYAAYLPTILLLIFTKSFSGIALTMLSIGFAAGIFKPLVSATVRAVTDSTNKTLGYGIFYAMVNIGGTIGPIVAGNLRTISWNYAFYTEASAILIMFLITLFFYKEPAREIDGTSLGKKIRDIGTALSDKKFLIFLIILGLFFWLPFWAYFNILPVYIEHNIPTDILYQNVSSVLPHWIVGIISGEVNGKMRILGDTISQDGYVIIIFQVMISRIFEKRPAITSFNLGLSILGIGFIILGIARITFPALLFLGVFFFAFGEMICSPRIQEYIMWIAPKEKAGLYMGTNFLATFIGAALSGIYTWLLGYFESIGHPEYVMFTAAGHFILGIVAITIFIKTQGEFKELVE